MQTLETLLNASTFKVPEKTPEEWAENDKRVMEWEQERKREAFRASLKRASIPDRYLGAGLEDCPAEVVSWAQKPTVGLLMQGQVGRGKTHAACAVAMDRLKAGSVLFTTFDDLLRECKATYSNIDTEQNVIARHANVGTLVIDDFGKERLTEWSLPIVFAIINKRSMSGKPTIITTQYTGQQLIERMTVDGDSETARAIISRLTEYTVIEITGRDRRRDG